jgi:hypothetical protein
MCVDCVLASPRIAQDDPSGWTPSLRSFCHTRAKSVCLSWEMNASAKLWVTLWNNLLCFIFCKHNRWHLICNNFNLNFIYGILCLYVLCLRILALSRIPRYDLGRQTHHFWGSYITCLKLATVCTFVSHLRRVWSNSRSKASLHHVILACFLSWPN